VCQALLLYRDRRLDAGVRVVAHDLEVLDLVVEDRIGLAIDHELGQRTRFARQLLVDLVEVVLVDVRVTARPDELTYLVAGLLRHHVQEQRVARDVERHAQEHVRAALCHHQRELALSYVELEHQVARRELDCPDELDVPGGHEHAARVGRLLDLVDHDADLVDVAAVRRWPRAPLLAVDLAEVAILLSEPRLVLDLVLERGQFRSPFGRRRVRDLAAHLLEIGLKRPLCPDVVVGVDERLDVVAPGQEPQQLAGDQVKRHLLRRQQRKPLRKVVAQHASEDAHCSRSRPVGLRQANVSHLLEEALIRSCVCHLVS